MSRWPARSCFKHASSSSVVRLAKLLGRSRCLDVPRRRCGTTCNDCLALGFVLTLPPRCCSAGFSPKTRLVMMFAGVFTGAGHGAVSIFNAAQDGDNAVDEDRERHAERRRRGLE